MKNRAGKERLFLPTKLVSMEISSAEGDDQQADNNESRKTDQVNKNSSAASIPKPSIEVEKSTKMKDKSESESRSPIKNLSKKNEVDIRGVPGPIQDSKLDIVGKSSVGLNQNLAPSKADDRKIKTDKSEAKGKIELNQFRTMINQSPVKTLTVPNKSKLKATNQVPLPLVTSKVVTSEVIQLKAKVGDQSSTKIKLDQNHIKPKLVQKEKSVVYSAEAKSKVEGTTKESGKFKKKFYFQFRVKDFNVISKKDDKKYKCHVCNGIYRQKFSLKRHFLRNHINIEYISYSDISNCKINVPNHKTIQLSAEETKLPSGRKRFKNKDATFLDNNKSRMMPGLYRCHECSEVKLDLESELKAHYVSHPNVQPDENFPCEHCSAVFQKRAVLNKHIERNHEKKAFNICYTCKQEFPSDLDFQKHLLVQGSGGKCKFCEKEFCTVIAKKNHERAHEGMKGYSCKHCHEVFVKIDDVKKHVVKYHSSLYLTCPHCPKQAYPHMFATKLLLSAHVLEKHGEIAAKKPLVVSPVKNSPAKVSSPAQSICNYCQKKFPGVRAMIKHKTIVHKRLLNKHKNAAQKKNAMAKKQSTMAAKQKAYNQKVANDKKVQQNMANKHKVLYKKRTTYERKAKQAVHDKSVIERFSTRRMRFETSRSTVSKFYDNLAQNIAENLLEHVDGKAHQLSIKNYNFTDNNEFLDNESQHEYDHIPWSLYNFPSNFDVQHALRKRGQEVKPQVPNDELCLFATGLGKVSSSSDSENDNVHKQVTEVKVSREETYDASTLRTLSLEDKKKLLHYNPIVVFICCVCKQKCNSFQEIDDHTYNNHPNVEPSWIEIEGTKDTPPLVPSDLCREPYGNPDGVLFSCVVPPLTPDICTLKCTKCNRIFPKSSELHQHLLDCGGNEGFRPKYRKKLNLQKRIKHTMKHRMDLSVKQVASKRESPLKYLKTGQVEKAKMKYGKDYFSTKTGKGINTPSPLTFQQKNITCFFCKEKFDSKLLLTEHYNVCSKFNRKRKKKIAVSPAIKKNLNNTNQASSSTEQSHDATPEKALNSQQASEDVLDLTMVSQNKVSTKNHAIVSSSQSSSSTLPDIILSLNKTNTVPISATKETTAMNLSVRPIKQVVVTKLTVPSNLVNRKSISNLSVKEKTPIEALHDTVKKIEANGMHKDNSNLTTCKTSLQGSKKTLASEDIVVNSFVAPKSIAPKQIVPNVKQNLPKIKEVVNDLKLAASISPNLKKKATPLMFIVSNADVGNSAVRNLNPAISSIKTKLNDQVPSVISTESKEQPRRKRKKELPTKVVQKTDSISLNENKLSPQVDSQMTVKNMNENQKAILTPFTESSTTCTISKDLSSDNVPIITKETVSPAINVSENSEAKANDSPTKSTLLQTNSAPIMAFSSPINSISSSHISSDNNKDNINDSMVSNEKSDTQPHSEDRDSPTLELLVSSVTQNIENFDKQDDEKFALPSLTITSSISSINSKAIESARNSLNFCVITPAIEPQTASLQESVALDVNLDKSSIILPELPIPETSTDETAKLEVTGQLDNFEKESPLKSSHNDNNSQSTTCTDEPNATTSENTISSNVPEKNSQPAAQNNQSEETGTFENEKNKTTLSVDSAVVPISARENIESSSTIVKTTVSSAMPNNSTEYIQSSATPVNECYDDGAGKEGFTSEGQENGANSSETIPKVPDSLDQIFDSVVKGGSWRRGRRPSKRSAGRPRGFKRNIYSKTSNESEGLQLSITSNDRPINHNDTNNESSLPSTNVSSQLRAFRIESSETSCKTASEALSGKSDYSNSSEVSSEFGKDLASRMKERMRLSFVGPESGNESEPNKTVSENQKDSSSVTLSEVNLNGSFDSSLYNPALEQSVDDCLETVTSIKKEFKDPELAKKHICPFCILEFAYLTNFRRHLKICRSKYENRTIETPVITTATAQIQHLPKKDEVEESMLNLLRHQSRQNQMIKETQPVKAYEQEKNFQKFNCEICHKIYFSLFKLMQHKMKEHLMPSAESKAMVSEDHSASELDEDSQCPTDVKNDADPDNLSNQPAEGSSGELPSSESVQNVSATEDIDNPEEGPINPSNNVESSVERDIFSEDTEAATSMTDQQSDKKLDELSSEVKGDQLNNQNDPKNSLTSAIAESENTVKKHSNDSSNLTEKEKEDIPPQKNYKELIDPNYFAIPSYGKGRGRKKKSLVENSDDKIKEKEAEANVSAIEETKDETHNIEGESPTNEKSDRESTSNELQSKRDIYLKILENCSKVSIVRNVASKDSPKLIPQKSKSVNIAMEKTNVPHSDAAVENYPAKKRGRPKSSNTLSVSGINKTSKSELQDMNDELDVYTVSAEKNRNEITVIKEPNSKTPSFLTMGSGKTTRKRIAADPPPLASLPKTKRGKYIRVKKQPIIPSPDSSEIETDDSASFIVSGNDVIPYPTQIAKFNSAKMRNLAMTPRIPQGKGPKKKLSAIQKPIASCSSMNKVAKASKSPKSMCSGVSELAAESSPVSNSAPSKSKVLTKNLKFPCDNTSGPSSIPTKGRPKNPRSRLNLDSSPDDFLQASFVKREKNTICPICKKKFSAPLLRNRHLQMAHGRKNSRVDSDTSSDVPEEQKPIKQFSSAEIRPKFQRHCMKPLPPLTRKYQKTITSLKKHKN
ncbi:hypothetical protein JTE90_020972 [Oedothorax gibbosus]|uniref:C2H2-type domain-containing protein n=1 Tax=Oedothorax gibbosus TaxID=931172 RepID=A0AAV6U7G8_9ARAC|nr:hypothetical protein JTE90_020972 [Oedothorax gibbosus]